MGRPGSRPAIRPDTGDRRRNVLDWQPENFELNVAAVRELREIAQHAGVSLPQLALAWVLHDGPDIVPIFGTRTPERIDENAAAVDATIAPELLQRVRELLPDGAFGSRYTDGHMPTSRNVSP